ncbi:choice-of-anchor D domain-containing protein [Tunturiibacter gelidoferens]|uniref:Choice-of-anchor D domain-containing protein n=1 Tax=Tunturiibacter gelidiferens TaxID=3069689 RepID=A0A9X0QEM8_9BACT|nr:choice-of-anchor D domain-containing protein [Edaphobacter lichenicola]MBB5329011.1 hypothetical protein [Edaphobacter lichenicola]
MPTRNIQSSRPILFEPSPSGEVDDTALMGRATGITIQLRRAAITVSLHEAHSDQFEIKFAGAQPSAPQGTDLQKSETNYLVGTDPNRWRIHVPNYGRVTYASLYAGIDAVFYGNGRQLEHDFIVSPGADYRQIRMHLSGNTSASLDGGGSLCIPLAHGSLKMQKPFIYQADAGKKIQRSGAFRLLPGGDIGFSVAAYDSSRPLIIDPVLSFSTYLSPAAENANLIATDAAGNNYVSGYGSLGIPVTSGAFAGCSTCTVSNVVTFVTKLSPDGTTLLYSTVLGGNSSAQPTGLAVDANGNAIVSGWTGATDFPVKNGQQIAPLNNAYAGFLVSLSPNGSSLNYSTLLSTSPSFNPSSMTYAKAVALDSSGNAYVTGTTGNGFFTTPGALNQGGGGDHANQFNIFLAKFSPSGVLAYSAVLGAADPQNGGDGPIGSSAIAVDATGDAFVSGQAGILWPVSGNAYRTQIAGSMPYAAPFVTKVAPDASSLLYSTFLDYAYVVNGIAALPDGSVFIAGTSPGSSYPTTSGAFQPSPGASGGSSGGFLTQLDPNGTSLVYSTLIGDSTYRLNGLALDSDGDMWLAGETQDAQFPMVLPLQSWFPQSQISLPVASVATQFDPSGKTLKFSTFLGGNAVGYASNVAIDSNHRAHIAGASEYGMYTTTGVYAPSVPAPGPGFSGETFAYLAVIDPTVPAPALCISPNNAIYYSDVNAGGFSDQLLTITNCGTLPLTINSISAAAAVFTVPASENNCPQTIAAAQSCTVVVRYSPTSPGTSSNSTLTIESNAPIPQIVLSLGGKSTAAPVATFSPTSLTFASQEVGSTSAVQTVTLTNTGTANLTNFIIEITGANTAFSETSTTCNLTLSTGTSCSINVTFTPASAGAVMASLVVLDANGVTLSPQPLTISGTGTQTPFTIATQTGGSTGTTVSAGKPATYSLAALPANGYSGTLALNCSNLPTNASCTFTPSTLVVTGGTTAPFTVTINTAASQTGALLHAMSLGSLVTAAIFFLPFGARRRRAAIPAILVLLVFASIFSSIGCSSGGTSNSGGSGGNSGNPPTPPQTNVAPGTYTVQLSVSTGTTTVTQPLTLTVQ